MARSGGVRPAGNRVQVNIQYKKRRYTFTVNLKPTKTNLEAVARQRSDIKARLNAGESIDVLVAELKGEPAVGARKTLGYWAQHYLDVIAPEERGVADSTLMGYESLYNSHWFEFDERYIDAITEVELKEHLSKKRVGKKTKREAVALIKRIFKAARLATIEDWSIKRTKRDRQPEPDPYTAAERDLLLKALREMGDRRIDDMIAYRYFTTAFYSGMRTGELLGLHWQDYEKTRFQVWRSMVRRKMQEHTKTDRRTVLLTDKVISVLEDPLNPTRLRGEHIFLTPEGHMFKDADWLMERWRRAHKKSEVRLRSGLYPWRHTYISLALVRGLSINFLAAQVGNSPSIIEKHYAEWIPNKDDEERQRKEIEEAMR